MGKTSKLPAFLFASAFLPFLPVPAASALEPGCYDERAEFSPSKQGIVSIMTEYRPDLAFVQDGAVLQYRPKNVSQRESPVDYVLRSQPEWVTGDISLLSDAVPWTGVSIASARRSQTGVALTFDLSEPLARWSFSIRLSVSPRNDSMFEVSEDGKAFFVTSPSSASQFSVRSVRLTFPRAAFQSAPTTVTDFRVVRSVSDTLLVASASRSKIVAYRGNHCQSEFPVADDAGINADAIDAGKPMPLEFAPNTEFRNDSDTDGIANEADNCPSLANPDQADRNFDGVGDACSDDDSDWVFGASDNCPTIKNSDQKDDNANKKGDACEFDTDGDGIPDGADNAIRVKNPDQADADGDRIGDAMDNCRLFNPDQADLDRNGNGDVCDQDEEYRKTNDSDKDGILDMSDNCPKAKNPDQADTDTDGIGNACDNCPAIRNVDQADLDENGKGDACEDADGDGIEGWKDNCPTVKNPDQADSSNDGKGNACEDSDSDGVYDAVDNCPAAYNPGQEDVDSDGIGTDCDPKDDRPLESNRQIFIALASLIALCFIGGIAFVIRKISGKKPQ